MTQAAKVASAPAKPLMIYDGDCNFCKFWIIRWQQATEGRVEYLESREPRVAAQFPELPKERFETSVQFIETDGTVYSGAEAVFKSLTHAPFLKWPLWVYRQVPGVAPCAEWAYHFVAKRREGFSRMTRLLWGREGALPEHILTRSIFLRLLGIIYLCAFVSLGTQVIGLIGSRGILPADRFMDSVRAGVQEHHLGLDRYHLVPTLCWFGASDGFLRFLCLAGSVISVFLVAGIAPVPCLFLLWLIYLSLTCVGGDFLWFQWDTLLLETGFLAIFLAPLKLRLGGPASSPPSRTALWLLRWLLFRLMFESGLVKLLSGDPSWRHLTALNVHYETQPLPTWIGWYAHQLPPGCHTFCVAVMFAIELGAPFLIFSPRRLRFAGCGLLMSLQVIILLTGNYCFFNWLTIALCVLLLDDALLRKFAFRRKTRAEEPASGEKVLSGISVPPAPAPHRRSGWPLWVTAPLAVVILSVTGAQLAGMLRVWDAPPKPLLTLQQWIAPFRTVNTYGLFAVMTTTRLEIDVQGSDDGQTWQSYTFKYKPADLKRRPAFVAPHQPRLDWQMWFAAMGTYRDSEWFVNFCVRLLQGSPDVLALLEHNPFPNAPPRYIRAEVYQYHFSNFAERRRDGVWWRREFKGEYLPAISFRKTNAD